MTVAIRQFWDTTNPPPSEGPRRGYGLWVTLVSVLVPEYKDTIVSFGLVAAVGTVDLSDIKCLGGMVAIDADAAAGLVHICGPAGDGIARNMHRSH